MFIQNIQIQKTLPVFYSKEPDVRVKKVWLLCHGYAQLPEYFMRHFEPFFAEDCLFISPQGLSTFYIQGTSGRVGASWMTKHNREVDIDDINSYLNQVYLSVHARISPDAEWNILGFSQGVPVVLRWYFQSALHAAKIVVWAGSMPVDIAEDILQKRLSSSCLYVVNGNRDPFLENEIDIDEIRKRMADLYPKHKWLRFEGGHHLHAETLNKIIGNSIEKN